MRLLFRHRLLTVLAVLAVLGGFAHQVLERFSMHHHCEIELSHNGSHEHPSDDSAPGDGCNHFLCHHSVLAVIDHASVQAPLVFTLVEMLATDAGSAPDVEPATIDHPPQLS